MLIFLKSVPFTPSTGIQAFWVSWENHYSSIVISESSFEQTKESSCIRSIYINTEKNPSKTHMVHCNSFCEYKIKALPFKPNC